MKMYVKPTVDVVELSVKENIAVLPTAVADNGEFSANSLKVDSTNYAETVYVISNDDTSTVDSATL